MYLVQSQPFEILDERHEMLNHDVPHLSALACVGSPITPLSEIFLVNTCHEIPRMDVKSRYRLENSGTSFSKRSHRASSSRTSGSPVTSLRRNTFDSRDFFFVDLAGRVFGHVPEKAAVWGVVVAAIHDTIAEQPVIEGHLGSQHR
jgi:hypothetical protein